MPTLTDLAALHLAVAHAPLDEAPRLVLADFLRETGGDNFARGEALQRAVQTGERRYARRLHGSLASSPMRPTDLTTRWGFPEQVQVTEEWKGFPGSVEFADWASFAALGDKIFGAWPVLGAQVHTALPVQLGNRQWSWAVSDRRDLTGLAQFELPIDVVPWGLVISAEGDQPGGLTWHLRSHGSATAAVRALSRALVSYSRFRAGLPPVKDYPAMHPAFESRYPRRARRR